MPKNSDLFCYSRFVAVASLLSPNSNMIKLRHQSTRVSAGKRPKWPRSKMAQVPNGPGPKWPRSKMAQA